MHSYRSHTCGQLRAANVGQTVRLSGWIFRKRDHGQLLFIDLRDHYGLTQIVLHPSRSFFEAATHQRLESVITVTGKVVSRDANTINPNMPTGEIEIVVDDYVVHSNAEVLPFVLDTDEEISEEHRLKYRFLDLRREKMQRNIVLRSRVISSIRRRMTDLGFNEFQTPILTSSSPEGARDFLVPSRTHPGKFYALPQAPQQFKQLLMVSGFDRYFQIAPCFRDEDARADRSPGEFYQLDMEMSFATQDDVFAVVEQLLTGVFGEFSAKKHTPAPFPRISYATSMLKYGNDKPDLRNPLVIQDVSSFFAETEFKAFKTAVANGDVVRAIPVPQIASKPRSFYDKLVDHATSLGAKGLAYLVWADDGVKGPIGKFIKPEQLEDLKSRCNVKTGDAVFFMCDKEPVAAKISGLLRTKLGEDLDLIEKDVYRFCWIVDFPMFEKNDEGQIEFSHNPFSMPQGGMEALATQDPLTINAFQYDSVCNGVELSSGAVRNHLPEIMYKAFAIAGHPPEAVDQRFGGMIRAFKFGAPPHAGIAPGIDRIVMLLAEESSIREIIAFPLNQKGQDLLMNAPAEVLDKQLRDVHIRIDPAVLAEKKAKGDAK
jgi:aspartyl-tRNA synthetase